MTFNNVVGLLVVGGGIGWAIGYVHACFVKDREHAMANRLRQAAERDARLERVRSVR